MHIAEAEVVIHDILYDQHLQSADILLYPALSFSVSKMISPFCTDMERFEGHMTLRVSSWACIPSRWFSSTYMSPSCAPNKTAGDPKEVETPGYLSRKYSLCFHTLCMDDDVEDLCLARWIEYLCSAAAQPH